MSSSFGNLKELLPELFIGGWQPDAANGVSWDRGDRNRENQPGPEACWDSTGGVEPLGLLEMDDEEREV